MDFEQTKLSANDKKKLKEIYLEFEKIHMQIPTTYSKTGGRIHCIKTGTTKQKNSRQTSFGIVNYRGKEQMSKSTKKHPNILPLLTEFLQIHKPGFKFKTVAVNRNTISKLHLDSRNSGSSIIVGMGPYTGGQTILYLNGNAKKLHIKSSSLMFNGSEIKHKSEPFVGTRYSLVFFK